MKKVPPPDVDMDTSLRIAAQIRLEKAQYEGELRGLEIRAYSEVLKALRASGKPNAEKDGIIKTLRDYFNITEDRHKAEIRSMAFDGQLSLISKKINGYEFTEEWAFQAQRVYVPLSSQVFSMCKPKGSSKKLILRDLVSSRQCEDTASTDSESDSFSESELEVLDTLIKNSKANGWHLGKHNASIKPISVDVENGSEKEIEDIEQMKRCLQVPVKKQQQSPPKSPDITDVPRPKLKSVEAKPTSTSGKRRGVKRKIIEEFPIPPPPIVESSAKLTARKLAEKSKNLMMIKKSSIRPKLPKALSRRSQGKKVKESSSETSSADEGENGPMPPDMSSRVMSPVFSEVIRTSVLSRGKEKISRAQNTGDNRKNNMLNTSGTTKASKSRPNQKSTKLKNSSSTSGSRRKSKLNEKIDYDEVLMDLGGSEHSKQRPPPQTSNSEDDASRRSSFNNQLYDRMEYKSSEDCAVYTESLPINYHEDMEQVTDGVFKRPLPPSKGPKPWEIKDARLNHYHQSQQRNDFISDENTDGNGKLMGIDGVQQQRSVHAFSPPQINNVNDISTPTTPTKLTDSPNAKKQRMKSPLVIYPNIISSTSVVPVPPPVFSTTSVNKKRNNNNNNKSISVVDSLNLHLPTSATASSLAASSINRRPGTAVGGGCSMFSNSSALIAGARGTAPGILQQQRKAQPHILANSKVQRSFLPVVNLNIGTNNVVNNSAPLTGSPISIAGQTSSFFTPGSATSHTIQLPASPIPISAISSVNPSSVLGTSLPGINMSGAMPVGPINRSGTGTNIIFVQNGNGPTVGSDTEVPGNCTPIKSQPRAVILRRAQLPRQGNVMIVDMQKNPLVTQTHPGQATPFLQTARVLNAPGELSLVSNQPSTSPRKNSPTMSLSLSTSPSQVVSSTSSIHAPLHIHQLQAQASSKSDIHVSNTESLKTSPKSSSMISTPVQITTTTVVHPCHTQDLKSMSPTAENANNDDVQGRRNEDTQYAQIEAELMQMEHENFGEVVYEEEVTTEEDNENTQYVFASDTCANADGDVFLVPQEPSSHNVLSTSGSSTDTAPESETSFQNFELSENDPNRHISVSKINLSPTGEVQLASEAISRALSLSKSSAKRLTITTPISLSTAATLAESLANSNKRKHDPSITTSTQGSTASSIFNVATTELHPTVPVPEADPSCSTSVHIRNSELGAKFMLDNNPEVLHQR